MYFLRKRSYGLLSIIFEKSIFDNQMHIYHGKNLKNDAESGVHKNAPFMMAILKILYFFISKAGRIYTSRLTVKDSEMFYKAMSANPNLILVENEIINLDVRFFLHSLKIIFWDMWIRRERMPLDRHLSRILLHQIF